MIKINILYPNTKDARFDMDYYLKIHAHVPLSDSVPLQVSEVCEVERGLGDSTPGSGPRTSPYAIILFNSLEDFLAAFTSHAAVLQGDMPNYTDVKPLMQVSAVEITR